MAADPLRPSPNRPNVIVVLTDDQGYGDLSCHGNPALKTPHLDKLHDEAIRFTDFHVAPMCTPTRGQIVTGVDCLANGAWIVCSGRSLVRKEFPAAEVRAEVPVLTIGDIFHANGYHTGHFGKWHLGDNYPYRAMDRGFEESITIRGWGIVSSQDYWLNGYFDDHYWHNGQPEQYHGYCTDVWFEEAMKWMRARARGKEPFLV
jgi:arylsulfatase A-like enzyme